MINEIIRLIQIYKACQKMSAESAEQMKEANCLSGFLSDNASARVYGYVIEDLQKLIEKEVPFEVEI